MATKSLTIKEVEEMTSEDLAEQFKNGDLELCVEPLSEWGSELETLFQKLEKGVMQWYDADIKRSFIICFKETATETAKTETEEKELGSTQPAILLTPALAS
jgi:hypothetical protein